MPNGRTITISDDDAAALTKAAKEISAAMPQKKGVVDLCNFYKEIKPSLDIVIEIFGHLGAFGARVKTILATLEKALNAACGVP